MSRRLLVGLLTGALVVGGAWMSSPGWAGGGGHMECHFDENNVKVCNFVADDNGVSGAPGGPSRPSKPHPSARPVSSGPTTCTAADGTFGPITSQVIDPQPPPPSWATEPGTWYHIYCGTPPHYRDDEWIPGGGGGGGGAPTSFTDLAQQQLRLLPPTINMNPDASRDQIVGVPTWLWVNQDAIGTRSATVHAGPNPGGVTVSGSVHADTVTFDMGDGTPALVCKGADATNDPRPSGPSNCSHTYMESSAKQLPDHTYTVTATVIWSGDYTVTDDTGATTTGTVAPFPLTSQTTVRVAEAQSINTG